MIIPWDRPGSKFMTIDSQNSLTTFKERSDQVLRLPEIIGPADTAFLPNVLLLIIRPIQFSIREKLRVGKRVVQLPLYSEV